VSTTIRPEVSGRNKYWIERHRYYELKHFCLQYPIWKKSYAALDGLSRRPADITAFSKTNAIDNPTARCAEARICYSQKTALVEKTAVETDSELSGYILRAVTEGVSYEHLKTKHQIPCCRDTFYDLYRRFFWLLNSKRD